jgi:hypothetical protein
LYKDKDGKTEIEVKFENDTVWLSQEQMSILFDKAKSTINEHIKKFIRHENLMKVER